MLRKEVASLAQDYTKYLRPKTQSKHLFVRLNGKPVFSKHFTQEIKILGKQLGIQLHSSTATWKLASSMAHDTLMVKKRSTGAKAMCHSTETAARHYQNVGEAEVAR